MADLLKQIQLRETYNMKGKEMFNDFKFVANNPIYIQFHNHLKK